MSGTLALPTSGTFSGLQEQTYINAALAALVTLNQGSSAPTAASTGLPSTSGVWWHDTANNLLKLRDQADTTWIVVASLDETNKQVLPLIGGGVATLASAATVDLGSVPQTAITVSGTTAITSFGTSMLPGQMKLVTFSGALTLTYNATSLILPGAANVVTAAGDIALVECIASGNFRVLYQRASGQAVVATGTPIAGGTVSGLKIANDSGAPNSKIDVSATNAVLVTTTGVPLYTSSLSVVIDCTTTGANGLDTGSLASATWYYIYLISNGTSTAGLASLSATSPAMPSGYSYRYRVGAMVTDASAHLMRTLQLGKRVQYTVTPSTNTANMPQAASGSAGNITVPTWVAVPLSGFVPSTAGAVTGSLVASASQTSIVAPNSSYGAYSSSTNPPPVIVNSTAFQVNSFQMVLESTNIFWASSAGSGALYVLGWEDNI